MDGAIEPGEELEWITDKMKTSRDGVFQWFLAPSGENKIQVFDGFLYGTGTALVLKPEGNVSCHGSFGQLE